MIEPKLIAKLCDVKMCKTKLVQRIALYRSVMIHSYPIES